MNKSSDASEDLVRSRQRVIDYGEVFTPNWMVEDMLNLVKSETERIDSRFLEPACGSGNFLIPVLRQKLSSVETRYGKNDFNKKHYALLSIMSIYGIELLIDNVKECRTNLLALFSDYLAIDSNNQWSRAALSVLDANIVEGNALTLETPCGGPITMPEWGYLGKGKFQRRDFRFDNLTQRSSIKGTLFEMLDEIDFFKPHKVYPLMTIEDIAHE